MDFTIVQVCIVASINRSDSLHVGGMNATEDRPHCGEMPWKRWNELCCKRRLLQRISKNM